MALQRRWLVLIPGVLFAGMCAMLILMSRSDFKPPKRPRGGVWQVDITADKPFDVQWPKREEPPAPAWSPRLTEFEGGRWLGSDPARVTVIGGVPEQLVLATSLPDPDRLSVREMGSDWCKGGLESPDCALAQLRVTVWQEAPSQGPAAEVLTSTARGRQADARSGGDGVLRAFWFKSLREPQREEFVGWDCPGEARSGRITTDPSMPLLERNRCFEPTALWRLTPKLGGYERAVMLTTCADRGRRCTLHFPFRGRLVETTGTNLAPFTPSEEAMQRWFLATWEFLNRLQQDTFSPPAPGVLLSRARNYLENCRAVKSLLPADRPPRPALEMLRWQCGAAMTQAALAAQKQPRDGADLIWQSYRASFPDMGVFGDRKLRLAIEAMARGGGEKPVMAQMHIAYARAIPGAQVGSETWRRRREAVAEAARLAAEAFPAGSEEWNESHRMLIASLDQQADYEEKIAALERLKAAVTQALGTEHLQSRAATFALCEAIWAAQRQPERLKDCADEYFPSWLAAFEKESAPRVSYEGAYAGIALFSWYATYGLRMDRPREVLPTMRRMAALLEPRVDPAVWARQAQPNLKYVEDRARR